VRPTRPTEYIPAVADDTVVIASQPLSVPKASRAKRWWFTVAIGTALISWGVLPHLGGGSEPAAPPAVVTSTTGVGSSPTPTPPVSPTATTAALPTGTPAVTQTIRVAGPTVTITKTVTATVTATVTQTVTAPPPPSPTPTPTATP